MAGWICWKTSKCNLSQDSTSSRVWLKAITNSWKEWVRCKMYFNDNSCLPFATVWGVALYFWDTWDVWGAQLPPPQRAMVHLHLFQHLLAMPICLHPTAELLGGCISNVCQIPPAWLPCDQIHHSPNQFTELTDEFIKLHIPFLIR